MAEPLESDRRKINLQGANLQGANLQGANLQGATFKNSKFGNNPGLSEEMRAILIKKGAIFEVSAYSNEKP